MTPKLLLLLKLLLLTCDFFVTVDCKMPKCAYTQCSMYDVEVNVDTDTCTKCVSPYPGPDGKLSVKCQHGCTNGRVMRDRNGEESATVVNARRAE